MTRTTTAWLLACLTVLVGTLYPLALEALTGEKISVGAPFFNLTFAPLFIPLVFAMPFGPLMAWKRGDILGVAQRLTVAFGVGIVAIAVTFAATGQWSSLAPFGIGLGVFVMIGAVTDVVERSVCSVNHSLWYGGARSDCHVRPGGRRSRTLGSP